MSDDMRQEPSDWHSYTLLLSRGTLTFLVASLDYYVDLLEAENAAILEDRHLLNLLGSDSDDDADGVVMVVMRMVSSCASSALALRLCVLMLR